MLTELAWQAMHGPGPCQTPTNSQHKHLAPGQAHLDHHKAALIVVGHLQLVQQLVGWLADAHGAAVGAVRGVLLGARRGGRRWEEAGVVRAAATSG